MNQLSANYGPPTRPTVATRHSHPEMCDDKPADGDTVVGNANLMRGQLTDALCTAGRILARLSGSPVPGLEGPGKADPCLFETLAENRASAGLLNKMLADLESRIGG